MVLIVEEASHGKRRLEVSQPATGDGTAPTIASPAAQAAVDHIAMLAELDVARIGTVIGRRMLRPYNTISYPLTIR